MRMVIVTKEEFDSWQATTYLLSTPANREALRRSEEQAKQGQYAAYDFGNLE